MAFPFNFFLAAFATAFGTTLLTLPLWRKGCQREGLVDNPGLRKIHDRPIPLAGGFAVLTGLLLPLDAGAVLFGLGMLKMSTASLITYGLHRRVAQLGALAGGAIAITVLGWLDDKHELKPLPKFAGQCLIAVLVAAAGIRVTLFVPNLLFSYAVTILWLLTVINAFNFIDNMNGLCTGLGTIGALFFGLIAASHGQYLVGLIAFQMCGALLGFLPYNFPKARAFLGDAGSHLVGYLLAVLAILPHFYTRQHPDPLAVFSPLLVLAVPLLDLAWVVAWRTRVGRPFWIGDTNHLSHQLVRAGLSRTRAVLLLWVASVLLALPAGW